LRKGKQITRGGLLQLTWKKFTWWFLS